MYLVLSRQRKTPAPMLAGSLPRVVWGRVARCATASAVCGYLSAPIGRDKPGSPVLDGAYLRLPTIWQRRGALFLEVFALFMLAGLADVKRADRAMIAHDTSPDFAGLPFFLRDWLHGVRPE